MRKTPLFALIVLLLMPSAFCTVNVDYTTRLRLQRATSPDGEWEDVPAETLPVVEGEFEDAFGASSAYYRMRIGVVNKQLPPTSMPLDQVPPIARQFAQRHLDENRNMEGDNGWEGAVLGPTAFPMYNPAAQGIAYIEFKVIQKPTLPPPGTLATQLPPLEDRGFILVSVTRNDFLIVSYATEGPTRTEMLRELAKSAGVRIFRYDSVFMVAENALGEMAAHLGSEPVRYPDSICDYIGKEFEHVVTNDGEQLPQGAPDLTGEAYESYQAFKQAYLESEYMKRARQLRKEEATIIWDLYEGINPENFFDIILQKEATVLQDKKIERFIVGDASVASIEILDQGLSITGEKVGGTVLHVFFAGGGEAAYGLTVRQEGILSPQKPAGWSSWTTYYAGDWDDQRRYYQTWCTSCGCYTGCGPVAWAMLYGWFDYKGYASLISGGPAPLYNDSYVEDCIMTVRDYVDTYCAGSPAATNPWEMPDGYRWARDDRGISYSISTTYSISCFPTSSCREEARNAIRDDDRPAIIGLWCSSAHYCVAYGYRYREWTDIFGTVWSTERQFKCRFKGGS